MGVPCRPNPAPRLPWRLPQHLDSVFLVPGIHFLPLGADQVGAGTWLSDFHIAHNAVRAGRALIARGSGVGHVS